jgi:hypothetical protein
MPDPPRDKSRSYGPTSRKRGFSALQGRCFLAPPFTAVRHTTAKIARIQGLLETLADLGQVVEGVDGLFTAV